MKQIRTAGMVFALLFSFWSAPATSAALTFSLCGLPIPATPPGVQTVIADCGIGFAGSTLLIDIYAEFPANTTIGGGFDFNFSTEHFEFVSWSAAPLGDPNFARPPDVGPGLLSGFAFGEFQGLDLPDPQLVGTLEFTVLGIGFFPEHGLLALGPNANNLIGPFIDANTFDPIDVNYSQVRIVPFPVPAAGWLLISGVVAVAGVRRRRR